MKQNEFHELRRPFLTSSEKVRQPFAQLEVGQRAIYFHPKNHTHDLGKELQKKWDFRELLLAWTAPWKREPCPEHEKKGSVN
jgi:hypothetical protein